MTEDTKRNRPNRGGNIAETRGPRWWYPVRGQTMTGAARLSRLSRLLCAVCPVRDDCATFGLRHSLALGTWGGLSPRARLALVRDGEYAAAGGVLWLLDPETREAVGFGPNDDEVGDVESLRAKLVAAAATEPVTDPGPLKPPTAVTLRGSAGAVGGVR